MILLMIHRIHSQEKSSISLTEVDQESMYTQGAKLIIRELMLPLIYSLLLLLETKLKLQDMEMEKFYNQLHRITFSSISQITVLQDLLLSHQNIYILINLLQLWKQCTLSKATSKWLFILKLANQVQCSKTYFQVLGIFMPLQLQTAKKAHGLLTVEVMQLLMERILTVA
jgi:hypothetical protein